MNKDLDVKYPSLFTSADTYSIKAQQRFINLNKLTLFLLFVSTILASINQQDWAIWTSSLLLILSAIISSLMLLLKFEKGWYEGRALAESIKTLCWKYMTKAKPFGQQLEINEAEEALISNFKKVIGQRKDFFELVGSDFARYEQLPSRLSEIRSMDRNKRISFYKNKRLEKQKNWYSDKADENGKWKDISFGVIIIAQLLGIIALVINFKYELGLTLAPIFIVLSTSFIAWLQLRRYQELSQSYLITATELSLIKSKIHQIETEEDFSNFVDDAETAISREHTLWLARRDNIDLFK
jgi:hypothetical protein